MRRPLPLGVWAGIGVGAVGLLVLAAAMAASVGDGARRTRLGPAAAGGAAVDLALALAVSALARTLDELHRRVRMADGVAERYQRSAATSSAGMAALLSGLVGAEEDARGQLAAELHDTAAQSLAIARRLLGEPGGDPTEVLEEVGRHVEEAEDQLRAVMARTRPPALRDGDLAAAVGVLCDDFQQRYGLAVRLAWPASAHPLPLASAVTVYRFFQEALLNVVKHSDVDCAEAALDVEGNAVLATVGDAGSGFDVERLPRSGVGGRHVGLGLLRERARLAGGGLTVCSAPGQGTTVRLRLPHRLPEVVTGVVAASAGPPAPAPRPVPGGVEPTRHGLESLAASGRSG